MKNILLFILLPLFSHCQRKDVNINGTGRPVYINNGGPGTVTINYHPTTTGEFILASSSGLSKSFNSGSSTNFDLVNISDYTRVQGAGSVDRVRFNLALLPTGTFTHFHIRVWRKDGATYDLVGQQDIPKASLVLGNNEHINSAPFDVAVGDYVGLGITGNLSNAALKYARGATGVSVFNTSYPNTSTNMDWDAATAATVYFKIQLVDDSKTYITGRRGVAIGNSTVADLFGSSTACTSIADLLLTNAELQAGYQCRSIATPGDFISQQRTAWNALTDHTQYDWIIVQIGLNDVDPAVTLASTLADYQALIDDIRADAPNIKIICSKMNPAKAAWATRYPGSEVAAQAKWVAMNDAFMGTGGTPITGADAYISGHVPDLDDGSGNLAAAYDIDGIHPNDAGRAIVKTYWRAKLIELGFLQ